MFPCSRFLAASVPTPPAPRPWGYSPPQQRYEWQQRAIDENNAWGAFDPGWLRQQPPPDQTPIGARPTASAEKGSKGKGKGRSSPYPQNRPQQVPIGQSVHTPYTVPPPFRPQYGYTQTPIPPPGLAVATPDPSTHYPPILGFETWLQNYRNAFGTEPFKQLLSESGLGNHPEVIRFMYRAGKAISEDSYVGNSQGANAQGSSVPQDFDGKANALYSNQQNK